MKNLYFILFDQERSKVLAVEKTGGFALPAFNGEVNLNVSFQSPHPFNRWFRENFGVTVFRRYAIDSLFIDDVYFIVELAPNEKRQPTTGTWVDFKRLEPVQQQVVSAVAADFNRSYSMPWIKPTGFREYLDWTINKLHDEGVRNVTEIRQIKNAFVSTVFCIGTDMGCYYLKIIGSKFVREGEITQDIIRWGFLPTVEVIAFYKETKAYLMRDMGGCNLKGNLDSCYLKQLVKQTADFQKQIIERIPRHELTGYYDLTLPTMQRQLASLVSDTQVLLQNSRYQLTSQERDNLATKLEDYQAICTAIDIDIPNSLDHGDLRPGNVRICEDGSLLIYDWAWTTYTHPFFMVNNFLNIIRRNEIVKKLKAELVDDYLREWTEFAPIQKLKETYKNIEKLTYLYHTVIDAYWLHSIVKHYPNNSYNRYSADGWLIDRRQYYYSDVVRNLIRK